MAIALALGLCGPAHGLGLTLPTTLAPAALSNLIPGATATTPTVPIGVGGIAGPWTLSVQAEASSTPGHLRNTSPTCSGSEVSLQSPLRVTPSSALPGTSVAAPFALDGTPQTLASGNLLGTVSVSYSQDVLTSDAVATGCTYGLTVTYTVTP